MQIFFPLLLDSNCCTREVKETAVIALRWLFLKPWRVWQKSIPPIFLILRMTGKEELCCLVFNVFTKPSQMSGFAAFKIKNFQHWFCWFKQVFIRQLSQVD